MAGDVSDKKSGFRVIGHDEVVEISGYGIHGHVTGCDAEAGRVGERGGQNRQLDLLGYLQFLLNLTELQVPLQGLARGEISESPQKHHKTNWLDVGEPKPERTPDVLP